MDLFALGLGWDWVAKMALGFLASMAGIMLWAHSRQPAWIFIILATLLAYVQVLAEFIDKLGLFSLDSVVWQGLPVVRIAFAGLVPLLYAVGLFLAYRSHYRP